MTVFMKNGIEISMPDDDEQARQNMIVAADFMARMIQKYGKKVLAKIEAREKEEAGNPQQEGCTDSDSKGQKEAVE